jgi:hypothetical protein
MFRQRLSIALVALLAVFACDSDSTEPGTSDLFVLRTVSGNPLPVALMVGDYTNIDILADTIRFGLNGTGVEVFVTKTTYADDPVGEVNRLERPFQYRMVNGTIEIEFPCPGLAANTASCIAPPHYRGRLEGGTINFDFALGYPTPMLFEKAR